MPVYSILVADHGYAVAGNYDVLYTVPAGKVLVVRDIDGTWQAAGAQVVYFGSGSGLFTRLSVAALNDPVQWRGRQVFEAGQVFQMMSPGAPWRIRVSGYLLSA